MSKHPEKHQLWMIWPERRLRPLNLPNTPVGYSIRTYQKGDESAFLALMAADTEFDPWDEKKLAFNVSKVIPGGWFFAIDAATGGVVGTAMGIHNYSGQTPFAGDVGWVACEPAHRGRGLGYVLTAYATARFIQAGYSRIQLHTEYYRLPAIKTYLKLGYLPVLYCDEVRGLWQEVCKQIDWGFTPEAWPRTAWDDDGQGL